MTIRSERSGPNTIVLYLSGRLDTISSPGFEQKVNDLIENSTGMILDLKELVYISSSGLHVLLQIQKTMSALDQKLIIRNCGGSVRDVFDMTGFSTIVTLED